MDALSGYAMYLVAILTMGGIYALLTLGLNLHWGYTGLMNVGIAGFVTVGAYTSAILTTPASPTHLGGFELPVLVGMAAAAVAAGFVAWLIGLTTLRLRSDYLAIATIGIGEILRMVARNEQWLTNGSQGMTNVPKIFGSLPSPWAEVAFLGVVLVLVAITYWLCERAHRSPWGRVQRAIRDNESAAAAAGKHVEQFRLASFVFGAMVMGLGGAMMAQLLRFVAPETAEPLMVTFLVWVMLVAGGSGNNRGALVGAFGVWFLWSLTDFLTRFMPDALEARTSFLRIFLIGLALQLILIYRPQGLVGEKPPKRIDES
jgi:branched-chain amino acid transport system permease protein